MNGKSCYLKMKSLYYEMKKNKIEQNYKLLNAKFDTLQCKNNQLLQMIENFAIEFLKTREYEF